MNAPCARIEWLEALSFRIDDLQSRYGVALDRLHLALDVARIGVWDWNIAAELDDQGVWQLTNRAEKSLIWDSTMFDLFDASPDQWDGTYRAFADLLVPEDAEAVSLKIKRCIATREPYDYSFRTKSGRHIHGCGKCYYGADGRPERFTGVCLQTPSA